MDVRNAKNNDCFGVRFGSSVWRDMSGLGASKEKTLTIAMGSDLLTFDTQNHLNISTNAILNNMTNQLFRKDANAEVHPWLATSWKQIGDTVWSFTLHQGVKFHNGDPLTAKDVRFTLMRAATDKSLKEYPYFKVIKDVRVVDDYTVEVETFEPTPTMLRLLSKQGADILPKDYIEKKRIIGKGPTPSGTRSSFGLSPSFPHASANC